MIVVGENLKGLIRRARMCNEDAFDEYSITLKLDEIIFEPIKEIGKPIRYGTHSVEDYYKEKKLKAGDLTLKPGDCVLACSNQEIKMPLGYIGFVQTKGTLARMFVSAHCADSQIEPGFEGKVTLELINNSPFEIIIPVGSAIAQIYITRCSTDNCKPYSGKYKNCQKPTLPLPIK